jgi:hypothetical protein
MPLFSSPEAPHFLSITAQSTIDGPVHLSMTVLDEKSRVVENHRLVVDIAGNCALVGRLVEKLVCGWESGVNTRYLFDGLARILRTQQTVYDRR